MKIFAMGLGLLALVCAGGCKKSDWREVTGKNNSYVIEFPCKPDRSTDSTNMGEGRLLRRDILVCTASSGVRFSAVEGSLVDKSGKQFMYSLEMARLNIIGAGGKIESEDSLTLADLEGVRFHITTPASNSILGVTSTGTNFFVLEVTSEPNRDLDQESKKFFRSFRLPEK